MNLFKPIEGNKKIIGILKSFDESSINLEVDEKEINIPRKSIALIKTVYNWE